MFQTGYLTIDEEEQVSGTWFYRLRYPNQEVYQSLNTALLEAWTPQLQTNVSKQIKDRGYADKYAAEGQPIHLIGVEFSRKRRTLAGFEVESLVQP